MMKVIKILDSIFELVLKLTICIACILIVLACILVGLEIVMRYFLNRPQAWVLETTEYILVFITFIGSAWVLARDGHVKMDLVIARLNIRTQATLNVICHVLGAISCLICTFYSAQATWSHFLRRVTTATVLEIPKAPILSMISIGFLLLSVQFLRMSLDSIKSWRTLRNRKEEE
ncbi:TRAP transporter small permease subunit [Thermodesulfobacteriota bacterium]